MRLNSLLIFVAASTFTAHFDGNVDAADEYRVETIDEPAADDNLAAVIGERLRDQGLRVVKGANRTVMEIWLCKEWTVSDDFQATADRLYPFRPGQLMGVARLRRRGSDFRDQDISRGLYTLRYSMQPIDGNHVGTSPTRDFLLLVRVEDDKSAGPMEADGLLTASATAAGSTHPAMLCLQKLPDDVAAPSIRAQDGRDWWVLRAATKVEGNNEMLPIDVVVVGHAEE